MTAQILSGQRTERSGLVEMLEFDSRGRAAVEFEGIILRLRRTWGLLLELGGDYVKIIRRIHRKGLPELQPENDYSDMLLADYRFTNSLGVKEGKLFEFVPAHGEVSAGGTSLALMPGLNSLEVIIYHMNRPEKRQSRLYEFCVDGRVYDTAGIRFVMEDHAKKLSDAFLDRLAGIALTFESTLPGMQLTKEFLLTNPKHGGFSQSSRDDCRSRRIEVACNAELNEAQIESSLVHESAHDLYNWLNGGAALRQAVEPFERFYYRNKRAFGKAHFGPRLAGEVHVEYDPVSVFGVFKESNYKGEQGNQGHPWDNPTELFASVTAITTVYTEEFFEKLALLGEKERDLAREVVARVVELYRTHCKAGTALFPKRVLEYCGSSAKNAGSPA